MKIYPKHYLVGILGLILSIFLFIVNRNFGNPYSRCFYLSFFTFLLWLFCWLLYFEVRDIWNNRWSWKQVEMKGLDVLPLNIPIKREENRYLYGEHLLSLSNPMDSPLIIFIHGFSDDVHYIRHNLVPLVHAGYQILSYDSRGTKRSRKAGAIHQFKERVFDLGDVIEFAKEEIIQKNQPIYLLGTSIGSTAAIYQGLRYFNNGVEKIITLASIGDYSHALPHSPVFFKRKWWVWIRYRFFNVPINPLRAESFILSPLYQIRAIKSDLSSGPQSNYQKISHIRKNFHLIHAVNDPIIPVSHFFDLYQELDIPSENWILTQSGGHNFITFEPITLASIITFLKK